MSAVLTTYLQDHHAGSAAGVAAFRRIAKSHGDARVRDEVAAIAREIEADQDSLEQIMDSVGAERSLLKDVPARAAEWAGRFKLNERLTERSPLSDVLELEALSMAVHGKALGWELLRGLDDPRLDAARLDDLHGRALDQLERLNELRLSQSAKLLSD